MQNRITKRAPLLDTNGAITTPGYATELILDYDRSMIKANAMRIKEWDYYIITNTEFAFAVTIADNGYMGLLSASFLDYRGATTQITKTELLLFTNGKLNAPNTSAIGDFCASNKKFDIKLLNDGKVRRILCEYKNFDGDNTLKADILLEDEPKDSMVIATPFSTSPKQFYYNQKINCLKVSGEVSIGKEVYTFDREDALGTLDWGRGVWSYKNTWYWGSMSTYLPNGDSFGFNIGYGFGDTSAATENMLFHNGCAHKLEDITFNIPMVDGKEDFMSKWTFTSSDKRFEMEFVPILNRNAKLQALVLGSIQDQVFGRFYGQAVLDNGDIIVLNGEIGFAEKVANKM